MEIVPEGHLESVANKFRLLGEPARLRILNLLGTRGEMNVQEVSEATGESHANVSKHLRLMAEAGLVSRRQEGLYAYYRISDPSLAGICLLACSQVKETAEVREVRSAADV